MIILVHKYWMIIIWNSWIFENFEFQKVQSRETFGKKCHPEVKGSVEVSRAIYFFSVLTTQKIFSNTKIHRHVIHSNVVVDENINVVSMKKQQQKTLGSIGLTFFLCFQIQLTIQEPWLILCMCRYLIRTNFRADKFSRKTSIYATLREN